MRYDSKQLKEMSNVARAYALRAIKSAGSGHVGIVMGAADIVTTVFANFLRRGQDRFVLSAGHGSALLYAVLKLAGYKIGDMESFRQIGGLPGHPEYGIDGVWATTGPLGQGVGNAVGLALGEKIKQLDGVVYCLCGDGDLMEGVAQESIAFAGNYKLNNLVLLWDDNKVSIDGRAITDIDVPARMRAAGWNVISVDGNDFAALNRALTRGRGGDAPVFIQCKTQIGAGTSVAGKSAAHGLAINQQEMETLIRKYNSSIGAGLWMDVARDANAQYVQNPADIDITNVQIPSVRGDISSREMSGLFLEQLMKAGVRLIGGSADLAASTNVKTAAHRDIVAGRFVGNFINYGVREFAMGAIMNGLAAAGLRPYGSTFLAFSDYVRPAIRLSAISGLPVAYVFTHDSIAVGQDGPTHQPVEQLASLRLIPNLNVVRPCNMAEVAYAWQLAIKSQKTPTCIVLSRQKFRQLPTPRGTDIQRGAYVIYPAQSRRVNVTIIATGAEVPLAVDVAKRLGTAVQVVSCPNLAAFCSQDLKYIKQMLRGTVVAIEASCAAPWFAVADIVFGIDEFGISGPGADVYDKFGFNPERIADEILAKIRK